MNRCALLAAVAITVLAASRPFAQTRQPLPRAVVDVRASSVGLPTGSGWTPAVPTGAVVPNRGFGIDAGGHVHVVRFKGGAIGLGAHVLKGRGHASPPAAASTNRNLTALPDVTTTITSFVPQLSFNFGHRLGWSYLSGGLGRSHVVSHASGTVGGVTPAPVDSPAAKTLDYGGGARWFINEHIAVNLDLRWYKLSPIAATATEPFRERQSLVVAGGGISIK